MIVFAGSRWPTLKFSKSDVSVSCVQSVTLVQLSVKCVVFLICAMIAVSLCHMAISLVSMMSAIHAEKIFMCV
jgi:hypothetical protein